MASSIEQHLENLERRFRTTGVDRRTFLKVAGAAAAGTAFSAGAARYAGPAAAATASARQATGDQTFYHFNLQEDPVSFDWNLNLYTQAEEETFAGLLTFDSDLNAIPDWAERFEPNADASVWTFYLRQDNKGWTNGDPVTAEDFVWSFTRQLDPANAAAYAGFLFDIKNAEAFNTGTGVDGKALTGADLGLKAIDQWTLEVTMEGPRAYFPQVVAYLAAFPSHRPSVEQHGAEKWASGEVPLVSNGPFKLDRWEHDVVVELSKNEGYWNAEAIQLTKVYDPIVASDTAVQVYERGEGTLQLDWVQVGAADLPRYQQDPALATQLKQYVYPGIWMLVPSNGRPPFDKIEVRRALSHAVDRTRLAELTQGLAIEAYGMVPIGVYGYFEDPAINDLQKFDPQLAMDALKGTEFEGGQGWPEITMHMRGSEEHLNAELMANDIVSQLKEHLNMNLKIQVWPEASWRPELFKNEFDLVWIRWWYDYPDPNNGYGDMFYSRKSSGKRQAWSNAEFDDLVNAGKGEPDLEKRLEIYKQAERIIQDDVGYIPVVYRVDQYAFKPWVRGVPTNRQGFVVPDGNIYVRMLTEVSIDGRPAE